jgi:integrase
MAYAGLDRWAGAATTARPVAHDEESVMSETDRTRSEQGITPRHARGCRHRESRCTCAPTFQAQVWDARAGKRVTRTFSNVTAARRWRQDAAVALRAGTLSSDAGSTLADAAEEWLDAARAEIVRNRSGEPYKPSAIRGYEQNLRKRVLPALGHERLREITLPMMQRYVDRLAADGLAAATITTTITPLRAIYRRARQVGEVHANPTTGVSVPAVNRRQTRFATSEQIEAMLDHLDDAKDRALWATALYAGLRRGEVTALHREDVDLATGVIRVERGYDACEGEIPPKSKQGRRRVPIPAVLRDRLAEHLIDAPASGRIFTGVKDIYERGRAAARAAGVEEPTLHECRHGYAALMIAAGVNVKALSTFMGHANIGITLDQYGHLLPGAEDEAAGMLDAFLARQLGSAEVERPTAKVAARAAGSTPP